MNDAQGAARVPKRRTRTAREVAEEHGVSIRTIMAMQAEPRYAYEDRARRRENEVWEMKQAGMKNREIAEAMDTTENAVKSLFKRAKKRREA